MSGTICCRNCSLETTRIYHKVQQRGNSLPRSLNFVPLEKLSMLVALSRPFPCRRREGVEEHEFSSISNSVEQQQQQQLTVNKQFQTDRRTDKIEQKAQSWSGNSHKWQIVSATRQWSNRKDTVARTDCQCFFMVLVVVASHWCMFVCVFLFTCYTSIIHDWSIILELGSGSGPFRASIRFSVG